MAKPTEPAVKNETTNAVALVGESDYMVLTPEIVEEAGLVAADSMASMTSILKLDQIKCPSGGGIAWKLQAFDGPYSADTFEAIIVKILMGRKFWRDPFTGKGTPPDCTSSDTISGVGTPGGNCARCPMNAFDEKTKTKPCREFRTLILMRPDSMMPVALSVPVTSIDNLTKYVNALAGGGKRKDGTRVLPKSYYGVSTVFGLTVDKSQGGIEYSKMTFSMGSELNKEQTAVMRSFKKAVDPIIEELNARGGNGGDDACDPADE